MENLSENAIAKEVVDAAYKIHKKYGPGLLEKAYRKMLRKELSKRGLSPLCEVVVPLEYEGEIIDEAFIADIIVNGKLIIELKATEAMHPVYCRQLHTYLKITDLKLGLLINFGMPTIKEGLERIVNGWLGE